MDSLFGDLAERRVAQRAPLADRMRPRDLLEYIGQRHILAPGRLLRRAIEADRVRSLILYGPPGTGKTTLARVIAHHSRATFIALNAVLAGVKVLREEIEAAQRRLERFEQPTLLFIDEIHRFNQSQQDALLPWVERGVVTLIGATTENPYFEVNAALNSRSHIFQLKPLTEEELIEITIQALGDLERGYGHTKVALEAHALAHWVRVVNGDARALLNALEIAVETTPLTREQTTPLSLGELYEQTCTCLKIKSSPEDIQRLGLSPDDSSDIAVDEAGAYHWITLEIAEASIQERAVIYDQRGDQHFDTMSAFIKSMRGSDPDAALYWLAKMIYAGEPPRGIFRRLLIFASEDIGLAWSQGVGVVRDCAQAFDRVGMPEGRFHLAHATLAMATAPKSNSVMGFFDALRCVKDEQVHEVPHHLRDAHRDGEALGHGAGYLYPHAYQNHWVAQAHVPEALQGRVFYQPSMQGEERSLGARVHRLREAQLEGVAQGDAHPLIEVTLPEEAQIIEWTKRAEGGAAHRWSVTRDQLLRHAHLERRHITLDLNAGTGLLTWAAVRSCVEGGVYSWCTDVHLAEQLSAQASALPWTHRPIVGSGSWSALTQWEVLRSVTPDRVIGRDLLRTPQEWTARLDWLISQVRGAGRVILSERHPHRAQRLSALEWKPALPDRLHAAWSDAEDQLYRRDEEHLGRLWTLDQLKEESHARCLAASHPMPTYHTHEVTWRSRLTSLEVERWCGSHSGSYLSQLAHHGLEPMVASEIASFLRGQVGVWLTWREERIILVITGPT